MKSIISNQRKRWSFRGASRSGLPDLEASPESITTVGGYDPRAGVVDSGLSMVGLRPTIEPLNDHA